METHQTREIFATKGIEMARRGRPKKKNVKRHPGGQPVRVALHDKGSEWVQCQRAKYGTHYNTALGRAYAGEMLGKDAQVAHDRYIAGKRFARIYNRVIGGETYRCALDASPRGGLTDVEISEYDQRDRDWLFEMMKVLDASGTRPWLDQLLSRLYTDTGPYWLDNLLAGGQHPADKQMMAAANAALDRLVPERRQDRILVAHYGGAA
ncbi:MAG: hypothetical protein VX309_01085 [Pseudomonadota bacterium]|nr:hypothetical protein [Pseudomonadota bacterium]MEE3154107.1 hypothetical protein [Pseudomonadota bacterium]